ncbi:MAG: M28 family peptidase [Candidatus Cloacimonetes bacterium]|nr:M28 family peptidase [Candidatus Cloacimonadota bacterium]
MKKANLIFFLIIITFITFGCTKSIPKFDGERAFQLLEKQCSFGPRNPNSDGHLLCKNFLINFLKENGAEVKTQKFSAEVRDETYELTNIIASYYPQKRTRIFLGAHWDTRPWADLDSVKINHSKPILGANDGASGVAVLLHLAEILNQYEPVLYGFDIILFDGEDAGTYGSFTDWCLGSKYFVNHLAEVGCEPEVVIIIDMIGDKNLNINIEQNSYQNSPELVEKIWKIAAKNNISNFKTKISEPIFDDHYPFLEKGFQAIDIIDFDYPYWHTLEDTPDKCSAKSLQKIGDVLMSYIYKKL